MKPSFPRLLLHLEGLGILILSVIVYAELGDSWLKFILLFLVPDIFMIGYLVNKKVGARLYNLVHTYSAPCLFGLFVYFDHRPSWAPVCLIWIAHIAFDRLLGFGLKYESGFKDTHFDRV